MTSCEACRRPSAVCVCDRVQQFQTSKKILILQHPQEQDVLLGTAQLLISCLPNAQLVIGLSWRNLSHALFGADANEHTVDVKKWAVLFPDKEATSEQVTSRQGAQLDPASLEGMIVIDGTWSKAKTLWWRNPWLLKLNRMNLMPKQPSIYGRLRAEPKREYISTLESVALALSLCNEPKEIETGLLRIFRTLVQRVRDANLPLQERKLVKKPASKPSMVIAATTENSNETKQSKKLE